MATTPWQRCWIATQSLENVDTGRCPVSLSACVPPPGLVWHELENGGGGTGTTIAMAVFNMLQVSTYHHPSSLLKLRKMGLVPPTSGVAGQWSLLTSLSETSDVSKTGTKDDSVPLYSDYLHFLEQAHGHGVEVRLCRIPRSTFHQCPHDLQIDPVPYQARHSGPSID